MSPETSHRGRRSTGRRRMLQLLSMIAAGLLVTSCTSDSLSGGPSSPVSTSLSSTQTSTPSSPPSSTQASTLATRPPTQTLPGETELQADKRIMLACLKDFGITPEVQPDGSYKYTAPTPSIAQQIGAVCQQRLVDAGLQGDYPLTDAQIRAAYDHAKAWRQCAIDHGHPLPPMISFEEYAASGGKSPHIVDGVTEMLGALTRGAYNALMQACPQD